MKHTIEEIIKQCILRWELSPDSSFELGEARHFIEAANTILEELRLENRQTTNPVKDKKTIKQIEKPDIYNVSRVAEFVGSDGKTNCIKVSENYWHEEAGDYFYTLYELQEDGTEIALLDNEYDSILYTLCDKLNSKADLLSAGRNVENTILSYIEEGRLVSAGPEDIMPVIHGTLEELQDVIAKDAK